MGKNKNNKSNKKSSSKTPRADDSANSAQKATAEQTNQAQGQPNPLEEKKEQAVVPLDLSQDKNTKLSSQLEEKKESVPSSTPATNPNKVVAPTLSAPTLNPVNGQSQSAVGYLNLTIKEALLTNDTDAWGKMDPYCTFLWVDKSTYKTEIKKQAGKHPIWNQTFQKLPLTKIQVENCKDYEIKFEVQDEDAIGSDRVGEINVSLKDLLQSGAQTYSLGLKKKPAGTFSVVQDIQWVDTSKDYSVYYSKVETKQAVVGGQTTTTVTDSKISAQKPPLTPRSNAATQGQKTQPQTIMTPKSSTQEEQKQTPVKQDANSNNNLEVQQLTGRSQASSKKSGKKQPIDWRQKVMNIYKNNTKLANEPDSKQVDQILQQLNKDQGKEFLSSEQAQEFFKKQGNNPADLQTLLKKSKTWSEADTSQFLLLLTDQNSLQGTPSPAKSSQLVSQETSGPISPESNSPYQGMKPKQTEEKKLAIEISEISSINNQTEGQIKGEQPAGIYGSLKPTSDQSAVDKNLNPPMSTQNIKKPVVSFDDEGGSPSLRVSSPKVKQTKDSEDLAKQISARADKVEYKMQQQTPSSIALEDDSDLKSSTNTKVMETSPDKASNPTQIISGDSKFSSPETLQKSEIIPDVKPKDSKPQLEMKKSTTQAPTTTPKKFIFKEGSPENDATPSDNDTFSDQQEGDAMDQLVQSARRRELEQKSASHHVKKAGVPQLQLDTLKKNEIAPNMQPIQYKSVSPEKTSKEDDISFSRSSGMLDSGSDNSGSQIRKINDTSSFGNISMSSAGGVKKLDSDGSSNLDSSMSSDLSKDNLRIRRITDLSSDLDSSQASSQMNSVKNKIGTTQSSISKASNQNNLSKNSDFQLGKMMDNGQVEENQEEDNSDTEIQPVSGDDGTSEDQSFMSGDDVDIVRVEGDDDESLNNSMSSIGQISNTDSFISKDDEIKDTMILTDLQKQFELEDNKKQNSPTKFNDQDLQRLRDMLKKLAPENCQKFACKDLKTRKKPF